MHVEGEPLDRSDFKFRDFFSKLDTQDPSQLVLKKGRMSGETIKRAVDRGRSHEVIVNLYALAKALSRN
jgi:hypothetical protein